MCPSQAQVFVSQARVALSWVQVGPSQVQVGTSLVQVDPMSGPGGHVAVSQALVCLS